MVVAAVMQEIINGHKSVAPTNNVVVALLMLAPWPPKEEAVVVMTGGPKTGRRWASLLTGLILYLVKNQLYSSLQTIEPVSRTYIDIIIITIME